MKQGETGFTLIEVIVAAAIVALIALAANMSLVQVIKGNEPGKNRITAVRQVQNAGYWISCDARMAESVVADNLTPPDFLILTWTEWDDKTGDAIHHKCTYFLDDLSGGIAKIKRTHWSSAGANDQTLVAEYIYYDPEDPDNTSKVSYQSQVLTLQLTAVSGDATETGEYMIKHRLSL